MKKTLQTDTDRVDEIAKIMKDKYSGRGISNARIAAAVGMRVQQLKTAIRARQREVVEHREALGVS